MQLSWISAIDFSRKEAKKQRRLRTFASSNLRVFAPLFLYVKFTREEAKKKKAAKAVDKAVQPIIFSEIKQQLKQDNPARQCVRTGGKHVCRQVKGIIGFHIQKIGGIQLQINSPLFDVVFR